MGFLPDEVERLALLGWRLYPSSRSSKAAMFKGATDAATYDLNTLEMWAREYRTCNWRVVMEGSGIWALDVDAPGDDHDADGLEVLARWEAEHGSITAPMTRSGGGGHAIFFRDLGAAICRRTGYPEAGIDPRAGRLSITVPPSIHIRTRKPYEWMVKPWELSPGAAPTWLLAKVAPPPEKPLPRLAHVTWSDKSQRRLKIAIDEIVAAGKGTANETLNRQAYAVARHVAAGTLGESEAVEALYAAARHRSIPHAEAKATILSAFRAGRSKPLETRRSA